MKIVTLGEIMIRLQPYDHLRFVQTDTLQYTYGGGEANEGMIKLARKYSFDKYGEGRNKIITLKQFHKNVRDRASPLIHRCRQPISAQRTGAFCKCGYPWDRLVRDPQSHRHDQAS